MYYSVVYRERAPVKTLPTRSLLLYAALAMCAAACTWMLWPRPIVSLPTLSREEIVSLGDSPEDRHRLYIHLSAILLGRGQALGPWQKLPTEAQHVWTTLHVEAEVDSPHGLAGFLPGAPGAPGAPTLADAAAGYREMGSAELAECMDECAASLAARSRATDDFAKRYQASIGAARAARVEYQRRHVAALAP